MDDDVKELLGRATQARQPREAASPHDAAAPRENRYVYGGESLRKTSRPGTRQNRKIVRRRFSTFNTIAMLFGGGVIIVLYVNHIITIDRLAADVGRLQARYEEVRNINAGLRAEVNTKAGWDHIGAVATRDLGLTFPHEQPTPLTIDVEALARARGQ